MGDRTLADFRSGVSGALTRGTIDTTLLDKWIYDAYKEVGYAFQFSELEATAEFATVQGTYKYALSMVAADYRFLHEEGIWVETANYTGRLIREPHARWLRSVGDLADTTQQGSPRFYHRYGKEIWIRPLPDAVVYTLLLHYWRKLTKLTQATDVTILGEDWDEIIELGALYRGYRYYREFDKYINVRNDFLALVRSRAMEQDLEEISQGGLNIVQSEDAEVSDAETDQ